ncbi:MAG: hypothetical protein JXX14_25785 [Deltaproteobacteria bacterium]|nr:hypothetical protein [Deltaproteobacteria bacterium]
MKCPNKIHITLLFSVAIVLPGIAAADDDMWSLKELSVLAFDEKIVHLEEDEDERGVRMYFREWSPVQEQEIRDSLENTDIEYRLFPNRQSKMTVELYSKNASLKFNGKKQHKKVQIIVGNSRSEKDALNALLDPDSLVPLPVHTIELLKKGDVVGARKALFLEESAAPEKKLLTENRINVVEAALTESVAAKCNPLSSRFDTPEAIESAFLISWCQFSIGDVDEAEYILSTLGDYLRETPNREKESEKILQRIETHRKTILINTLLKYARLDDTSRLTDTFIKFEKDYLTRFFSLNLLEIAADHLIRIGLGSVLAAYSDRIMGRLDNKDLLRAAPVLAETYLDAGQYVKARDAASYFLEEKALPGWARGRLLRVRAYVGLQEGDWIAAVDDFTEAETLISLSSHDNLAHVEATVRAERATSTELIIPDANKNRIDGIQNKFATRLRTEIALKEGKRLSVKALSTLPDHALYYGLLDAEQKKNNGLYQSILKILQDRNSSWATLATIKKQTQEMQGQLENLKKKGATP